MLWRTLFPSAYIAADDLPAGREFTWHISGVEASEVHKVSDKGAAKKETKLVIAFAELDAKAKKEGTERKRYIPCKTVAKLIAKAYGPETDAWTGAPVTLYRAILPKSFGETNVPAIRAKIPKGAARKNPEAPPPTSSPPPVQTTASPEASAVEPTEDGAQ